ncbi:MAG: glycosyltransferase family 4 protein [Actinobacteria bacterium]|nr:glycosyltransferase family 4 protein [Actinomycetota bacterium]
MRVAYTLEQCWHRVPGGTARAALEVADVLDGIDDVTILGVAARHRRPPEAPWRPTVGVAHLPLPRPALYTAWHELRRPAVQRATGPVEVIHATGVAVPPRSAPLVVTVHDLAFLRDPTPFTRNGRRFFARALERTASDADLVLCSSAATREDCAAAGIDPARLRVVPLGVHAAPVDPSAVAATTARHGLHRPYVLAVGTLEPRKNLPTLVEAVRRLRRDDVDLVLVGPAGWGVEVDALVAGLGDRVHVLGFLPAAERDALYAGAAVFCYPSTFEGFGLPVLEAMAQGTPVVTSAGTAMAEVAGPDAVLVDPTDVEALRDAVAGLLEDPVRAAALGVAGARRAGTYTWERTAAATLDAYREALG